MEIFNEIMTKSELIEKFGDIPPYDRNRVIFYISSIPPDQISNEVKELYAYLLEKQIEFNKEIEEYEKQIELMFKNGECNKISI